MILGIVARQAPLPLGFSSQEYWSGLPYPPPGDLPNSAMEPAFLVSPALAGGFFFFFFFFIPTTSAAWEAQPSEYVLLISCCLGSTFLDFATNYDKAASPHSWQGGESSFLSGVLSV